MKTVSERWKEYYKNLALIDPNNPGDNWVIRKTMQPSKYPKNAKLIAEQLKPKDSVLEIGCGYGGLALEVLKLVPVSYTVVDVDVMLLHAEKVLGNKAFFVRAVDIQRLEGQQYSLFVSHFCLWETPREYHKYILEKLIKNCQNISVIDHDDLYIEKEIRKYFTITKSVYHTLSDGCKQFRYTGVRKEDL